jgi:hypothetical protein
VKVEEAARKVDRLTRHTCPHPRTAEGIAVRARDAERRICEPPQSAQQSHCTTSVSCGDLAHDSGVVDLFCYVHGRISVLEFNMPIDVGSLRSAVPVRTLCRGICCYTLTASGAVLGWCKGFHHGDVKGGYMHRRANAWKC